MLAGTIKSRKEIGEDYTFSETIRLHFGKIILYFVFWSFVELLLLNYRLKISCYPQCRVWISIALAKTTFVA